MAEESALVFADGASRGNPGRGGWGAVVLYNGQVEETGGRDLYTTNNRMELAAAIGGLSLVPEGAAAVAHTDSSYVINGITKWISGWRARGWMTAAKEPVQNRDLWEKLEEIASARQMEWKYVPGHSGVAGNERADEIAAAFADGGAPKLFNAAEEDYLFQLRDIAHDPVKRKARHAKRQARSAAAYSYVSVVSGIPERHTTWAACERRVKGVKGARYKKALSAKDERDILASWGF